MSHGGNRRSQYREVCETPFRKVFLERVKGIEPSYAAWEAAVLPLNYTRIPLLYNLPDRAWQSPPRPADRSSEFRRDSW